MLLALRLPHGNSRGPLYMEQALAAIHQADVRRRPFTLILARHDGQVGLFIRGSASVARSIQAQLFAAFPDAAVDVVPESTLRIPDGWQRWGCPLILDCPLFPIRRYAQFDDPLNRTSADSLTTLLTTLPADTDVEAAWIEMEIRPVSPRDLARATNALSRIARTRWTRPHARHKFGRFAVSRFCLKRLYAHLLAGRSDPAVSKALASLASTSRSHERESDLQAATDKIHRHLYRCVVRLVAASSTENTHRAFERLRVMAGAFGVFNQPNLASFAPAYLRAQARRWLRTPEPTTLLSAEEVATIWHPPTLSVQGVNVAVLPYRRFEIPSNLPVAGQHESLAILGEAVFRQAPIRFGILSEDRFRHLYLAGKTGMGKSTLLWQLITSDIRVGHGIAAIDPHGDLIESILPAIPSARTNDVILFDAGDAEFPIAFNPLACSHAAVRPLVASGVLTAFKKIFGDSWGPRLEHILRNSLLTLLEHPDASLLTLLSLLSDARLRHRFVSATTDPIVRAFWEREFASWSPKFQAEALAPVLNKLGHFISSPLLRNIVGQTKNRLDLRQVMDNGKVLLVNLAKGRIGEDASALLGAFLVTGLQQAAMARADSPPETRRDFFLYCDEFQNYTTDSFAVVLAEARKYRLGITLAHQFLAQTDEQLRSAVFGNVGTMGIFQIGVEDAELLAQQLSGGLLPDDILNVPRYHAYARLLIDGQPSRPFLFRTLPPRSPHATPERAAIIRRYSRQRYARPVMHVEQSVNRAFAA